MSLRRLARFLLGLASVVPCAGAVLRDWQAPEAQRVVVVANAADPESMAVARHYCLRRGVPETNIVAFSLPLTETISWAEFVQQLWEPLAQVLEAGGWIDWASFEQRDVAGRKLRLCNHHAVSYLVLCRGVPLRIANDSGLKDKGVDQALARVPAVQCNNASVDSELALMPQLRPPLTAYFPNPLFGNPEPGRVELESMFRVSRLDGPSQAVALALVDRALEAEARGLIGTAYVDSGGIYPEGDRWFEQSAQELRNAGFEVVEDRKPETFPAELELRSPILYLGWYAWNLNGPFAVPGFRFPAGAIAYHLHSFSATSLRSETQGWTGPLLARGATVSFGNVYEPYLILTLRPDFLTQALLRGWTVGAAAMYAQPAMSWQGILVGDPLYRPFALGLAQQLGRLDGYDEATRALIIARRKKLEKKP